MPSLLLTFDNFDLVHVLGQGRILKIAQDCCYGKNHHSVLTTVDHFISLPRDYYLYMSQPICPCPRPGSRSITKNSFSTTRDSSTTVDHFINETLVT